MTPGCDGFLVSLNLSSGASAHDLLEDLRTIVERSSGMEVLEAGEGLQAIEEAKIDWEKLAEGGDEAVSKHLERAQDVLTACVETVISNKVNLFPPLAQQKDWNLPGTHLPIGATINFGEASDLTVASWVVVVENWSGSHRLSCDFALSLYACDVYCSVQFLVLGQLRR